MTKEEFSKEVSKMLENAFDDADGKIKSCLLSGAIDFERADMVDVKAVASAILKDCQKDLQPPQSYKKRFNKVASNIYSCI